MNALKSLALLALIICGCATPYGPRKFVGGYTEFRLQNDIFRVVVDGNGFSHKSMIGYYALVRAAELTVQSGGSFFRVLGGDTDMITTNVFVPGQTFVNSNTSQHDYGRATAYPIGRNMYAANYYGTSNANTFATVSSTPSYATTIQKPIVTIDVQAFTVRSDPCFDAPQVLQGAIAKKLKLEAATLSALGLSPVRS